MLKGSDILKTYEDSDTDSRKSLKRVFCSECGSLLFALTPLREDIVSVAAGTLDDFENWRPDKEQYCEDRAAFLDKVRDIAPQNRHVRSVLSESESV